MIHAHRPNPSRRPRLRRRRHGQIVVVVQACSRRRLDQFCGCCYRWLRTDREWRDFGFASTVPAALERPQKVTPCCTAQRAKPVVLVPLAFTQARYPVRFQKYADRIGASADFRVNYREPLVGCYTAATLLQALQRQGRARKPRRWLKPAGDVSNDSALCFSTENMVRIHRIFIRPPFSSPVMVSPKP